MNLDNWAAIFAEGIAPGTVVELLWPVASYVLGMAIYAVFVFKFYRFIAARDMFGFDLSKNDGAKNPVLMDLLHLLGYCVKYLVLFPGFAFFWFAVLTLILVILSKDQPLSHILVVSLATVSVIRITAYYNENLSRDLAKILPFAVLGVFLIDASFFNLDASWHMLQELNGYEETIVYYLIALVALEFSLRLIFGIYKLLFPGKRKDQVVVGNAMNPPAGHRMPAAATVETTRNDPPPARAMPPERSVPGAGRQTVPPGAPGQPGRVPVGAGEQRRTG